MCPCCVQLLSYWGHSLPPSKPAVWDNNLNTWRISDFHSFFFFTSLYLCDPFLFSHFLPPSPPSLSLSLSPSLSLSSSFFYAPAYPHSLMVTLLSDCYISSHGKSAISPVSYHYANDGQFNFSWSEGEFLIRVRHSTQDREKDVKAEGDSEVERCCKWISKVKWEVEEKT